MTIKEFYLGSNTPHGFYSYYNYLTLQDEANRIICIKGGPGTGKSTLMRSIAMDMSGRGYPVEMMHCSSDPHSLDGVGFPSLGIAIVDGTSPHIVDPKYPGAVDEILHLGEFWDSNGIRKNKEQIIACNKDISQLYGRVYRYLRAAKCFYDDIKLINSSACSPNGIETEYNSILTEFAEIPFSEKQGSRRKMFASAITPEGVKGYLDSILTQKNIYTVHGDWGCGSEILLKKISEAATVRGFNVEEYYCPFEPESKIEHLIIPALNLAFTTPSRYCSKHTDKIIDLDVYADTGVISKHKDTIRYNREQFNILLNKSIDILEEAKALHDTLETYYIPYMNFNKIDKLKEKLSNELFV
ncbi:MAG: ATPase [Eubacteriales bacterium]|nr:ATPase [Eubacteriales bacterium]